MTVQLRSRHMSFLYKSHHAYVMEVQLCIKNPLMVPKLLHLLKLMLSCKVINVVWNQIISKLELVFKLLINTLCQLN